MKQYFDKLYKDSNVRFMAELRDRLAQNQKTFIVTANPEAFMFGEKDPEMHALLMDEQVTVVAAQDGHEDHVSRRPHKEDE